MDPAFPNQNSSSSSSPSGNFNDIGDNSNSYSNSSSLDNSYAYGNNSYDSYSYDPNNSYNYGYGYGYGDNSANYNYAYSAPQEYLSPTILNSANSYYGQDNLAQVPQPPTGYLAETPDTTTASLEYTSTAVAPPIVPGQPRTGNRLLAPGPAPPATPAAPPTPQQYQGQQTPSGAE
ncbi:hypothetical protein AJ79_01104 [Helicocarpus griseus UAMH5409]|uniref:Uncharacterized protein n=1 Tax=Helicocarpus griseus UAMH5409 TaxID=1447875 RepID=A0A2B7Y0C1_9EURO|nr:hypothetical protein AJ79_01104 [Helicocarpus griseus UAMH5409]